MKKILAVLVAIAIVFTMNSAAFAAKAKIPFWQNGGNVTTLISIVANDGTGVGGTFTSTGATITITLTAEDTSSGYTVSPTNASGAQGTTGQTFATATFIAGKAGSSMIVDTAQIGTNWGTIVWATSDAYSATAAKFGHGLINTGTAGASEFKGWAAVYGGTNPAGFTVDLGTI
jgi:hypothetical protein